MPKKKTVQEVFSIRLDPATAERADALIEALSAVPEIRAARVVTRSTVLRLALDAGLTSLEAKYGKRSRRGR